MSTITPPGTIFLQPPSLPVRRFTVDEYHRMIQAGILTEDDHVELLEGLIVPKMPHNPPHDIALELTDELIRRHLPEGWRIRIQLPITTTESEPEPDLAVVRGSPRSRQGRHPGPQELALIVEVSDATLTRDRGEKLQIYARAAIGCYWIVNLVDRQVEVRTDPSGPAANPSYRRQQTYAPTDAMPLVIGGQEVARIPVQELLP
jgi:Uma2 family endonuclease